MAPKDCFLGAVRRRTMICYRNVKISASIAARDRNRSPTAHTMSLTRSLITDQHHPILGQPPADRFATGTAVSLYGPCQGGRVSIGDRSAHLISFVSFFVRSESRFFVPTRTSLALARVEAVKVGRRTNLTTGSAVARPHLDSFEHDGTLWCDRDDDRRGARLRARSIAPQPCIRLGPRTRTMM